MENKQPFNTIVHQESGQITHEQLQSEIDYYRAQQLLDLLLEKGFLSKDEYWKITLLNRESFSPLLAKIMPNRS